MSHRWRARAGTGVVLALLVTLPEDGITNVSHSAAVGVESGEMSSIQGQIRRSCPNCIGILAGGQRVLSEDDLAVSCHCHPRPPVGDGSGAQVHGAQVERDSNRAVPVKL
eukprot:965268-Rhodomonas_salina.3